jgi:hypothetical protein
MLKTQRTAKFVRRRTWAVALVIGVLLGVTAIYGSAHVVSWNAVSGWYTYPTRFHDETSWYGSPAYSYGEDHEAWSNAAYPSGTSFTLKDIGYWYGTSTSAVNPRFWLAWAYDEYGNNSVAYYTFQCVPIEGTSEARNLSPQWSYGSLGSGNSHVVWTQWVEVDYWYGGGPSCGDYGYVDVHDGVFRVNY